MTDDIERMTRDIEQRMRELAQEATQPEALAFFGFGVCARCGKRVDDDDYTDCTLILDEDPGDPGTVLCLDCVRASERAEGES